MKLNVVDFVWEKDTDQIVKEKIGENAQLFMANEFKKLMDPYAPADQLILSQDVMIYTENGNGVIEYRSPYAHFQFIGELYVSSKTGSPWAAMGEYKVSAGKKLKHSTFRHPLATSRWDKAAWTARGKELQQAVQKYLDGGRE